MEPASAIAGTTQISSQCVQCALTITKWTNQVKSVDLRVTALKEDILGLQSTYENLTTTLKDPHFEQAARKTDQEAGGSMWSELSILLSDCQISLTETSQHLDRMNRSAKRVASVVRTVTESLYGGELARLRDRLQLLNTSLHMGLQMVNITTRLQLKSLDESLKKFLLMDISKLHETVESFGRRVKHLIRVNTWTSSTFGSDMTQDAKAYQHMETFSRTAKRFMASANAKDISNRSSTGTNYSGTTMPTNPAESPNRWSNKSTDSPTKDYLLRQSMTPTINIPHMTHDSESEDELELELTKEYLENGRVDFERGDLAGAEDSYRAALSMVRENDFSKHLAQSSSDLAIIVADCCMKQGKLDEAISLLESVVDAILDPAMPDNASTKSSGNSPETGAALQACHQLAVAYVKKEDWSKAEKRAKQAFKGRRKLLKPHHPMTLETVQVLIDIYVATDSKVNARAYRRFLEPPIPAQKKAMQKAQGNHHSPSMASSTSRGPGLGPSRMHSHATSQVSSLPYSRPVSQTPSQAFSYTSSHGLSLPSPLNPSQRNSQRYSYGFNLPTVPASPTVATYGQNADPAATATSTVAAVPSPIQIKPVAANLPPTVEPGQMPANLPPSSPRRKRDWLAKSVKKDGWKSFSKSSPSSKNSSTTSLAKGMQSQGQNGQGVAAATHPARFNVMKSIDARLVGASRPYRSRGDLVPTFQAIRQFRNEGKTRVAVDSAIKLIKEYDPDRNVLMVRESEIKKNIKESHKGLAATGYGYAPIHFFCERKIESVTEVQLLIEHDVDVNAIAYKAGMPGHEPFTPLQRAIERGHVNIVNMLIKANASLGPPKVGKINETERLSLQPMLIACTQSSPQIARVLLEAGGALQIRKFPARAWHGNSLLHEVSWRGDYAMMKVLLDYQLERQRKRQKSSEFVARADKEAYKAERQSVGVPGQCDHFGGTAAMYAVDLRDCKDDEMRETKSKSRIACLKLLLEHGIHGDRHTPQAEVSVSKMLSAKWDRGPGANHSIFCYADTSADEELLRVLDPLRYQCHPAERCAVTGTQCETKRKGDHVTFGFEILPAFPELMAHPSDVHVVSKELHVEEHERNGSSSTAATVGDDNHGDVEMFPAYHEGSAITGNAGGDEAAIPEEFIHPLLRVMSRGNGGSQPSLKHKQTLEKVKEGDHERKKPEKKVQQTKVQEDKKVEEEDEDADVEDTTEEDEDESEKDEKQNKDQDKVRIRNQHDYDDIMGPLNLSHYDHHIEKKSLKNFKMDASPVSPVSPIGVAA